VVQAQQQHRAVVLHQEQPRSQNGPGAQVERPQVKPGRLLAGPLPPVAGRAQVHDGKVHVHRGHGRLDGLVAGGVDPGAQARLGGHHVLERRGQHRRVERAGQDERHQNGVERGVGQGDLGRPDRPLLHGQRRRDPARCRRDVRVGRSLARVRVQCGRDARDRAPVEQQAQRGRVPGRTPQPRGGAGRQ
jgi:hypothetical protein